MKALSIRQPWAWCIVHGVKPVENRSWATKFRGAFAVHAGKAFDMEGFRWIRDHAAELGLALSHEEAQKTQRLCFPEQRELFSMGGIVGFASIVDCVDEMNSPWFFGPKGFVLEDARPCDLIPTPGKLSFFEVGELAGLISPQRAQSCTKVQLNSKHRTRLAKRQQQAEG